MKRVLIGCLALMCVGGLATADAEISATVVAVSGRSVYLDVGRKAGVFQGARVKFRLKSGALVTATIADVSANNARAEFEDGTTMPVPEDRAEVEVEAPAPKPPVAAETAPASGQAGAADAASSAAAQTGAGQAGTTTPAAPRTVPDHPPWKQTLAPQNADAPLLAPAFGTRPEDRPVTIKGRSYSVLRAIRDQRNGNDYLYARTGLSLEMRNAFGDGGRLRFQGDTEYRSVKGPWDDESESRSRVQRFSYAWGLDKDAPFRGEVGRFFSAWLPELGIVDGGEAALRFENGVSVGAGVGYYPTTTEDLLGGDDYGFHVFADYQPDAGGAGGARTFQGTIGFQQTFHEGEADRSLLVGRVTANPTEDIRLFGLAMVDLYGSDDTIETSSAELTQLQAQASFRFTPATGASVSLIHTSWPELKRDDYSFLPPEMIGDGYVDRLSAMFWTKLDEDWRLTARSHAWRDDTREGYGGELSLDWTLPTETASSLYGSVYYEDSAYTTGAGVRLQGHTNLGAFHLFLGYDGFAYNTDTVTGGPSDHLRHAVRGDVSWGEGQWFWDIDAAYTFGDDEESFALGVSVQYRF
jgi:hypothetical protein